MSPATAPGFYADRRELVNQALKENLPKVEEDPEVLVDAMHYSTLNGGKRLRGVLVLEAGLLAGGRLEELAPLAAAVEMIHAYSLVHDDLPAMDDDDFRRGQPTNHRQFGEAMAILTGDALLTRAFYVLSRNTGPLTPERRLEVIRMLTDRIGCQGLIGGQVLDLELDQGDEHMLEKIHDWKTGALIEASLLMGGLGGGASDGMVDSLAEFGVKIGRAFQIKDDLLDETGCFKKLGKETGKDEENGKLTYPARDGLESSRSRAERLVEEGIAALEEIDADVDRLSELARFVVARDR